MARKPLEFCSGNCGRRRVVGPDFFTEKETGRARPRCKHCMTKDAQRWNKQNPEKHKAIYRRCNHASNLKKRFGLTVPEFDALAQQSDGTCGICHRPETRNRRLSLDHNHRTGEIRGFLCSRCNLLLGNGGDNPDLLEAAATYLRGRPRTDVPQAKATFEQAWALKEAEGYQYGPDALEQVRFGWEIAVSTLTPRQATASDPLRPAP